MRGAADRYVLAVRITVHSRNVIKSLLGCGERLTVPNGGESSQVGVLLETQVEEESSSEEPDPGERERRRRSSTIHHNERR